ncbi:hypothetical protein [Saccharothrix syringae]|uniref:Uncharacterized protein n=1 Tax=Saccharothrix syringae TaxID=103733 RepID=A0A5Q0HC54_SACSY|nr:hypothetical protein [Saccharothrix syringae]QFZ23390.1 hypothetical protein EKG83_43455 [Saccharothrix syringae]
MDEVPARLLDERVTGYLDAVDRLAAREGGRQVGVEARRLAAAWRALLGVHRRTGTGRCRRCAGRGRVCAVWRVACAHFVHRLPLDRGPPDRLGPDRGGVPPDRGGVPSGRGAVRR